MTDPQPPHPRPTAESWVPAICLALALAAVGIVYYTLSTKSPFERLTIVVGYTAS